MAIGKPPVRLIPRPGRMTRNRQRVLDEYRRAVAKGEAITLARIARRCGLYSYREARRTIADLKRFGLV